MLKRCRLCAVSIYAFDMAEASVAASVAPVGGDMANSIDLASAEAEDGDKAGDEVVKCTSCEQMHPKENCIQKQKENALTNRKAKFMCKN